MLISEEYRAQNEELHKASTTYGTSGHAWSNAVLMIAADLAVEGLGPRVLDYGCGKATLQKALSDVMEIENYDPCMPGFSARPDGHFDLIVCTDVLEHIEPDYLNDVLVDIRNMMRWCGLFTVATRPAKKTLPDGRNAHLIIESPEWWYSRLIQYFVIEPITPKDKGEIAMLAYPRIVYTGGLS